MADQDNVMLRVAAEVLQLQAAGLDPYADWGLGTPYAGQWSLLSPKQNDVWWVPLRGEAQRVAKSPKALDDELAAGLQQVGGTRLWDRYTFLDRLWDNVELLGFVVSLFQSGKEISDDASGLIEAFGDSAQAVLDYLNDLTPEDRAVYAEVWQSVMELRGRYPNARQLLPAEALYEQTVTVDQYAVVEELLLAASGLPNARQIVDTAYAIAGSGGAMPPERIDRVTDASGRYVNDPTRGRPPQSGGGLRKVLFPAGAGLAGFYLGGPLGAIVGAVGGAFVDWVFGPAPPPPTPPATGPRTRGDPWA